MVAPQLRLISSSRPPPMVRDCRARLTHTSTVLYPAGTGDWLQPLQRSAPTYSLVTLKRRPESSSRLPLKVGEVGFGTQQIQIWARPSWRSHPALPPNDNSNIHTYFSVAPAGDDRCRCYHTGYHLKPPLDLARYWPMQSPTQSSVIALPVPSHGDTHSIGHSYKL